MTAARHRYDVVVNHDGDYSIWRTERELPTGWRTAGPTGTEADCLEWIGRHRTGGNPRPPVDRTAPDRAGSELPEPEWRAAVAAGTGPSGYDDGRTVGELIGACARRFPHRRAVTFDGDFLTYVELDRRATAVAARLTAMGIGADDVVGVRADRCPALLVALIAILRAGAAYLPLDPGHPPARIAEMVQDARPVLIVDGGGPGDLSGTVPVVDLRRFTDATAEHTGASPAPPHPDSTAYVIFTSGSTGRPKGVANTHRALRNRLAWMQDAYPLDGTDTVVQKTPLGFDVSVWELFWPLTVGAHLVLAQPGGHRDPDHLATLITEHRATVIHFVPSMLQAFLRAGVIDRCPSLRHVICSGEALSAVLRSRFLAASRAQLHNLYGPTEAAIDVTHYDCRVDRDPLTVPIGQPISGVSVHVLGPRLEALRPDVVGEIYIGGVGLARGYINQPALTADRFVPDPHGAPGGRLYRTGDLGRRRPDGLIEFLGRSDNQVALRGFRIELGEVEATIERVPGVQQAVVTAWRDESGGAGLAAYVVGDPDDAGLLPRARDQAASRLPDYMMPTSWSVLPELPLLGSGKVDRSRLPAPVAAGPATPAGAPDRAWTSAEQRVAEAWAHVLGASPARLDDDFFTAGGDSILAVELVVTARARGLALSVRTIFENRTPERLAAAATPAEASAASAGADHRPFDLVTDEQRVAVPGTVEDAYPLSTLLAGLVAQSQVNPEYRVYTTSLAIHGGFDEASMRQACELLLRRHPYLRSSIDLHTHDVPLQLVHRDVPDPMVVVDLRQLPPGPRQAAFTAWFAAEPSTRFDWSVAPLLRLTVHRFTDTDFRVTLTEPYLDGWSVTIALNELLSFYRALLGGERVTAVPLHLQATFLAQERAAAVDETDRSYWKGVLGDSPAGALPRSRTPAGHQVREVPVTGTTSQRLRDLAVECGVSVKSVLLAAHLQVIALLTGRTEVVSGLITNSRPETQHGAQAVGMFLNTIPVRVDVDQPSGRDLIAHAQAAETAALAHRHRPYATILRDNGIAAPLDSVFNYTHFRPYRRFTRDGPVSLTGIDANDQTYHRLTAQFRRDVLRDAIALTLEFAGNEFDADQADRIVGYYGEALRRLADAADGPVTPLDRLMTADERATSRPGPTAPAEPEPAGDLYTMFLGQVTLTPDADALRYDGGAVSYRHLAARVDTITMQLAERSIGPGSVVAVRCERSPGYVAAVLAVLRLGAVYLPVDPRHPADRVARMFAVGRPGAVVTADAGEGTPVVRPAPVPPADGAGPPSGAAVLLFTSGSTGAPKGVLLSHRSIVNRLAYSRRHEPVEPDDVFLLRSPIVFSDAVAELFDGLLRGAPTVILPDGVQSPDELVTLVERAAVTRVTLVPTLLGEILRLDRDLAHDLRRVRRWHISGEPLRTDLARALRAYRPNTVVCNLYGSTEVTADATVFEYVDDLDAAVVPVGTALPNVTVGLAHQDGGAVPLGTPGEVVVGGRALAIGYLNDPRTTAQRFVPAPSGLGERIYRTGDLGFQRADGVVELLGRADRQIKVRGVRVEPAEVEANLIAHDAVEEAVVVQREHRGRQVLVAYVRAGLAGPALGEQMRAFLRNRLQNAAVPDFFVAVDEWPRLPSGKVDVSELPAPAPARHRGNRGPEREHTGDLARRLAEIWRQELGTVPDDEDSFWHLGGQSLSAVTLARRVERTFATPFTVHDVYANPVFGSQVDLIGLRSADQRAGAAPPGRG